MGKDVHTEHCCIIHSCKYGDKDCTVTTGRQPQSYPCEYCEEYGVDPLKITPEFSIHEFKKCCYYYAKDSRIVMYVMGVLKDSEGVATLIVDLFMLNIASSSYDSVQGTKRIKVADWAEVDKAKYDELVALYKRSENGRYDLEGSVT